ncbi:MAG TPA: GNAT family N-acetyltransferase [Nitrobacter sp.]|jgi:CelD/BcsL family acetyltransferase involved in cellulose biosynthesis|nr:GNAT family N-acetyltransferase [Nitrobacter sp.]
MISVTIGPPDLSILAAWDDLVQRASSNVFMHPAALAAANDLQFADVRMLSAWDDSGGSKRLVGLWGLQVRKVVPFWPHLLEALPYNYAFLSSPVIDLTVVDEVIGAFLTAIRHDRMLPHVIALKSLDAGEASCSALMRTLAGQGGVGITLSEGPRPFATRDAGAKRSGSTRKKLRQDWNRLSTLGTVDIVNDRSPDAAAAAFEVFLALEFKSWKGAQGTALLCDAADAAFARRLLAALAERNSASVALLRVDGRPIAAQVVMYGGATAYTWKTAFDQGFAKYSPGALLIDRITEELFSNQGIDAINSCSSETSFMTHLWTGRRAMIDILADVGPGRSVAFRLEAMRQRGIERLRELRDWLKSRTQIAPARKVSALKSR